MSARLVFGGSAKTLGFGGAFLMVSGGDRAVTTGVLVFLPAGSTVVAVDPADVRRGSRVGIS